MKQIENVHRSVTLVTFEDSDKGWQSRKKAKDLHEEAYTARKPESCNYSVGIRHAFLKIHEHLKRLILSIPISQIIRSRGCRGCCVGSKCWWCDELAPCPESKEGVGSGPTCARVLIATSYPCSKISFTV